MNLRVLDGNGAGTDSGVINAINRAIQFQALYNIRVINLSLGRPVMETYKNDPLCQAVESAWRAGIVVVTAAGNLGRDNSRNNNGYGTILSPGNDPYVITVGAMKTFDTPSRADDRIATYSSKGPTAIDHLVKPDLVAAGNQIASTMYDSTNKTLGKQMPQNLIGRSTYSTSPYGATLSQYFNLSGTSMATPMVSGAAALLLQRNPSLTPAQIKARLMKTAAKTFPTSSVWTDPVTGVSYYSQYDAFTIGAGYMDIAAALTNTDVFQGSALSPFAVISGAHVYISSLPNSVTTSVWASTMTWANSSIWGSSTLWGDSVLWGDTAVWGDATLSGNSALWGTSALWGSSALWGDSVLWGDALSIAQGIEK